MASFERLFRGDLKDPHYSFELDLSLCIWPQHSSVQRIVVPLSIYVIFSFVLEYMYIKSESFIEIINRKRNEYTSYSQQYLCPF